MLFIVNPVSALGKTRRNWEAARHRLRQQGIPFDELYTTGPGSATLMTREALRSGVDRVIAVGGDGTLNEVVNGYFEPDGRAINPMAAVGLLPSGTGSDFQRTLGLADFDHALNVIRAGETASIDIVSVRMGVQPTRYLINVATFGLGGEAVEIVNNWRNSWPRIIPGKLRFLIAAVRALGRFSEKKVLIQIDSRNVLNIMSGLVIAANGRFAGAGMLLAPHAELDDGLLDIVLTEGVTRLDVIKELPRLRNGKYLQNPKVKCLKAHEVEIASNPPMAIDLDGEFAGYTPIGLKVVSGALRFIVPTGTALLERLGPLISGELP